jgi:hypothetical protein
MTKGYWRKPAAYRPDCDFLVTFVASSPQSANDCDDRYSARARVRLDAAAADMLHYQLTGNMTGIKAQRERCGLVRPRPAPSRFAGRNFGREKMKSNRFGRIARSAAVTIAAAGLLFEIGGSAMAANYAYMGCYDLWYARNAIYAQNGYCFKTAQARAVFGPGCFPPYGKMSKWEQREVSQIQYWEARKGCN